MYFDNSATSLHKPQALKEKFIELIESEKYGNPARSGHLLSQNTMLAIYETKKSLARLAHIANPSDIVLTENATYGLNFAIKSLVEKKDHVISSTSEHNSVLRPLYQSGCELSFVDFDENFDLDYGALEKNLRKNSKFLVINSASNLLGEAKDLDRLYDFAKANKLILIVDLAQSFGLLDMDLSKYENSIFAFTGHKSLYGPSGTGGLIKNGEFPFKEVFSGGSGINSFARTMPYAFPQIFEVGTANFLNQIALKASVDFILDEGIEKIRAKSLGLARRFYKKASAIDGIKFYSKDEKNLKTPIVSLNIKDLPSSEVAMILDEDYDIQTRPGAHCSPLIHKHLGTEAQGLVRFSFSYFNSFEEVDKAVEALFHIAKSFSD
jgi:hypothetical protein